MKTTGSLWLCGKVVVAAIEGFGCNRRATRIEHEEKLENQRH